MASHCNFQVQWMNATKNYFVDLSSPYIKSCNYSTDKTSGAHIFNIANQSQVNTYTPQNSIGFFRKLSLIY